MLIVRPKNCNFCGNGYYALGHVVQYARNRGWEVTDLQAEQAVKQNVFNELQQNDPEYFYGFGHGSGVMYTGDTEQEIFSVGNTQILADRIISLLSCLTAISLGPDIIAKGGNAYAGYDVEWTWITEDGTDEDPYNDKYARGLYESANELWVAVIENNDFATAVQRCIDKYNSWIDYWINENPEDEYSQEAIRWLAWNRDGLVMILNEGPCENGAQKCFGSNLHICENNEWVILEESSSQCRHSMNAAAAIPILLIVGFAFVVMTGKPKKKGK
jgi:hypothetical protein